MAGDGLLRGPQVSQTEGLDVSLGGDVTGSTLSSVVEAIRGRAVQDHAPEDGEVYAWSVSNNQWEPTAISTDPTMGGDVSGTASAAVVEALQGYAVQNHAPEDGEVLTWNDSESRWEPQAGSSGASTWNDLYASVAGSYLDISTDDKPLYIRKSSGAGPGLRVERTVYPSQEGADDALVYISSGGKAGNGGTVYITHTGGVSGGADPFALNVDYGGNYTNGVRINHSGGQANRVSFAVYEENSERFYVNRHGYARFVTASDTWGNAGFYMEMNDGNDKAFIINSKSTASAFEVQDNGTPRFVVADGGQVSQVVGGMVPFVAYDGNPATGSDGNINTDSTLGESIRVTVEGSTRWIPAFTDPDMDNIGGGGGVSSWDAMYAADPNSNVLTVSTTNEPFEIFQTSGDGNAFYVRRTTGTIGDPLVRFYDDSDSTTQPTLLVERGDGFVQNYTAIHVKDKNGNGFIKLGAAGGMSLDCAAAVYVIDGNQKQTSAGLLRLQDGGNTRIAIEQSGEVNITTASSGKAFDVTHAGSGVGFFMNSTGSATTLMQVQQNGTRRLLMNQLGTSFIHADQSGDWTLTLQQDDSGGHFLRMRDAGGSNLRYSATYVGTVFQTPANDTRALDIQMPITNTGGSIETVYIAPSRSVDVVQDGKAVRNLYSAVRGRTGDASTTWLSFRAFEAAFDGTASADTEVDYTGFYAQSGLTYGLRSESPGYIRSGANNVKALDVITPITDVSTLTEIVKVIPDRTSGAIDQDAKVHRNIYSELVGNAGDTTSGGSTDYLSFRAFEAGISGTPSTDTGVSYTGYYAGGSLGLGFEAGSGMQAGVYSMSPIVSYVDTVATGSACMAAFNGGNGDNDSFAVSDGAPFPTMFTTRLLVEYGGKITHTPADPTAAFTAHSLTMTSGGLDGDSGHEMNGLVVDLTGDSGDLASVPVCGIKLNYTTGGGSDDPRALSVNAGWDYGVYSLSPGYFWQNSSTGAVVAMTVRQSDEDVALLDWRGTSATDASKNLSTFAGGSGSVEGPIGQSSNEAAWAFEGMVKIEVNGTAYWMPYYSYVMAS